MNITFRLIFHIPDLQWIAYNYTEELSELACIVKPESKPVTRDSLTSFFGHGGVLAIALDGGKIVGAACLLRSFKYNDYSFRVEHVSTLPEYERRGIARQLVLMLHEVAFEKGDGHIDLTSEPSREGANRLYERLGYVIRTTNSRRFVFKGTT